MEFDVGNLLRRLTGRDGQQQVINFTEKKLDNVIGEFNDLLKFKIQHLDPELKSKNIVCDKTIDFETPLQVRLNKASKAQLKSDHYTNYTILADASDVAGKIVNLSAHLENLIKERNTDGKKPSIKNLPHIDKSANEIGASLNILRRHLKIKEIRVMPN